MLPDELHITGMADARYTINDIAGRTLHSGMLPAINTIKIEDLPVGMYLLLLDWQNKQEVLKFSKQ